MEVTFDLGLENESGPLGRNKQEEQQTLLLGDINMFLGQFQLCNIVIYKKNPMANNLINHAYIMKAPYKPKKRGFGELGWRTRMVPHATMLDPKLHGDRSCLVQDLTLCISSFGC